MIVYWPILLALLGLLFYVFAHNSKLVEIGRIIFFCGMLALAFWLASKGSVHLFK